MTKPALAVRNISKQFPGTTALSEVDLTIARGEIHALLGENGSGKSTLVKVLAGVLAAEPNGSIKVGAVEATTDVWSSSMADGAGIRVVHQDRGLFPDLPLADNMAAGHGYATGYAYHIRSRQWGAHVAEVLRRFHILADPSTLVRQLRPAERVMLAVARALQDGEGLSSGLLILDEPTAAMPKHEVDVLLDALRRYASSGLAILLVTHHLQEALELSSRITVLRDGTRISSIDTAGMSEEQLAELMLGRALVAKSFAAPGRNRQQPVLELREVTVGPIRELDLTLERKEVLGIAGLQGSGRTTLLEVIFGQALRGGGEILVDGDPVEFASPAHAIASGVAFVPEDRAADATFPDLSVVANLSAAVGRFYWNGKYLDSRREARDSKDLLCKFQVKAASGNQPFRTLSGGNQQKVILARWLRLRPKILLLDEPTQGVDVGARDDIHGLLRESAADGTSLIVASSDFEELARLCSRVVFLNHGKVFEEITVPALTADVIADRLSTIGARN